MPAFMHHTHTPPSFLRYCCVQQHHNTHTLWQEQASLASTCQCQGHVGIQQTTSGIKSRGVQPLPAGMLRDTHASCHRLGGPGSLLALVLLQTGFVAAFSLTSGANDAFAGRQPSATLDVPINFWVGARHARLAVHGVCGSMDMCFEGFAGLASVQAGEFGAEATNARNCGCSMCGS